MPLLGNESRSFALAFLGFPRLLRLARRPLKVQGRGDSAAGSYYCICSADFWVRYLLYCNFHLSGLCGRAV